MERLKEKSFNALIWKFAGDIGAQAASFAIGLVLARIISPEEYGLLAIVVVFTALSSAIIDGGMGTALIREKNADKKYYDTASAFNILIALLLIIFFFFSAPHISKFYNENRLTDIIRVMSLGFMINALGLVPNVILSKELHFKKMAVITVPAVVISGSVGIYMAYSGFGVWALVTQSLSAVFIRTMFITYKSKFIPAPYNFSKTVFQKLFSFGYKLSLSAILNALFSNIYPIIIGKLYSPADLGFYSRADSYKNIVSSNITSTLMAVTAPSLSAIQDDIERLRAAFRKLTKLAVMINTPVMLLLALLAKPLIILTITEKWMPSVPLLQIMCFAALLFPLHVINLNLLLIKGRSGAFFRLEIIKKIIIVAVVFSTYKFGVLFLVAGSVLISFLAYFLNVYYTKQLINYSLFQQAIDIYKFFLIGLFSFAVSWAIGSVTASNIFKIVIQSVSFSSIYLLFSYFLEKDTFLEIKTLIISKFASKR